MAKLTASQIERALKGLSGWTLSREEIRKTYSLKDFKEAMAFVVKVALAAEAADHHPDIDIRYRKVSLALSTHSEGGLTDKDFKLAAEIDA